MQRVEACETRAHHDGVDPLAARLRGGCGCLTGRPACGPISHRCLLRPEIFGGSPGCSAGTGRASSWTGAGRSADGPRGLALGSPVAAAAAALITERLASRNSAMILRQTPAGSKVPERINARRACSKSFPESA
ncbi:hypothetical protein DUI70_0015 [Streptomyces albus]|nr:hypothetical protein DUI70_0015 [Streptomyces albus]